MKTDYIKSLNISNRLKNVLIINGVLTKEDILDAEGFELRACSLKSNNELMNLKRRLFKNAYSLKWWLSIYGAYTSLLGTNIGRDSKKIVQKKAQWVEQRIIKKYGNND
jgi:hypothetical protein